MALSSHLFNASAIDSENASKMRLAARLSDKTPDNSIILGDKVFYSLGLLHHWHQAGGKRHWLLPLKKNTQYEVVQRPGRGDKPVKLKTSPQARKNGRECRMESRRNYPVADNAAPGRMPGELKRYMNRQNG